MKILVKRECPINGMQLKPGLHDIKDLNHKDRLTAAQLTILRDGGAIEFNEIVERVTMDEYIKEKKAADQSERAKLKKIVIDPSVQEKNRKLALEKLAAQREIARKKKEARDADRDGETTGEAGQSGNRNSGGGAVSGKEKNKSAKRSTVAK